MVYSKFEKARIVGARAFQLALNAELLVKVPEGTFADPVHVSYIEFSKGKTPLKVVNK